MKAATVLDLRRAVAAGKTSTNREGKDFCYELVDGLGIMAKAMYEGDARTEALNVAALLVRYVEDA